jgi:predicted membrane channel-forming protein YqfA (hemolysin III family)
MASTRLLQLSQKLLKNDALRPSFAHPSDALLWVTRFEKGLIGGVYAGLVASRLCSLLYHVFNRVSPSVEWALLHADLCGIACMALGSPYLFAIACRLQGPNDLYFIFFCSGMLALFLTCLTAFAYTAMVERVEGDVYACAKTSLLMLLAAVGNYPAVAIVFDSSFEPLCRAQACVAVCSFVVGYELFYRRGWPERYMANPDEARGKAWQSHVLWHLCASLGQLSYASITFLHPQ